MHAPPGWAAGNSSLLPSRSMPAATNRKPRAPNAFKQRDVQRALKAAQAAGFDVAGFQVGVQKVS
jgi:hypothetical protein